MYTTTHTRFVLDYRYSMLATLIQVHTHYHHQVITTIITYTEFSKHTYNH